jgi:hypothetical protein
LSPLIFFTTLIIRLIFFKKYASFIYFPFFENCFIYFLRYMLYYCRYFKIDLSIYIFAIVFWIRWMVKVAQKKLMTPNISIRREYKGSIISVYMHKRWMISILLKYKHQVAHTLYPSPISSDKGRWIKHKAIHHYCYI